MDGGHEVLKRTVTQKTRMHDNLYDPVFMSSSGDRGHQRHYTKMIMKRLERIADYEHMFSDTRPNYGMRVANSKHNVNIFPPKGESLRKEDEHTILGRDRWKWTDHPKASFTHSSAPAPIVRPNPNSDAAKKSIKQMTQGESKYGSTKDLVDPVDTPRVRTVGVQTLYRDSETQTDPYTPDYVLPEGVTEDPEMLSIAHFRVANGMLPVAQHEVEIIKRMRAKRDYLSRLPQSADQASLQKRKQMLATQEMKEWRYREMQMKEEQDAKLKQLEQKLRERDDKAQMYLNRRVQKLIEAKLKNREDKLNLIHHKRVEGFRKMRKEILKKEKTFKRDVVKDYADYDSEVYVSNAMNGEVPLKNPVVDYGIPVTSDYTSLLGLEQAIEHTQKCKPVDIREDPMKRRERIRAAHLAHMDRIIHGEEDVKDETDEHIRNHYKTLKPTIRPKTPEIEDDDGSEGRSLAAIIIQKLIRGRAVQNEMFEEKCRSVPLIEELQVENQVLAKDSSECEVEKDLTRAVDLVSGSIISHTLQFMARYVVQQKETNKVVQLANQAREDRMRRETEESERRREEAIRFSKLDEAIRMSMLTHQNSTDLYLRGIFLDAIDAYAKAKGDEAVLNKENNTSDEDGSEKNNNRAIVSQLVKAFVFPEVERRRIRLVKEIQDSRFTRAPHQGMVLVVKTTQEGATI